MSKIRHTPADEPFFLIRSVGSALPSGHEIQPHSHSWHQLIYAASGVMTVSTREGFWVTPPHWALWAPAGVEHSITFTGASQMRTLYLSPAKWPDLPAACTVISVSPLLREMIARTIEIGVLDQRKAVHHALALLIVDALQTQPAPALDLPMPTSGDLRAIAADLSRPETAGPAAPVSVAHLARRFGVGLRTLERRFHAETGMSIGLWRRKAQLMHGLRRLAAGHAVKDAAIAAGYSTASAFVSAFAVTFHTTPGRYFAASPEPV